MFMTYLGIDISDHNAGLTIPTDGSIDFVIARATLAETNQDNSYHDFKAQCKAAEIPFAAYHFVYPPLPGSTYQQQVDNFREVEPDHNIPVMLDVETDNDTHPTLNDANKVAHDLRADGYFVPLMYMPRWYWDGILKRPQLSVTDIDLVSSNYGTNGPWTLADGYATRNGDKGTGWDGYGGLSVALWQFTSQAQIDHHLIDGMAYKGSLYSGYFHNWGKAGFMTTPADRQDLAVRNATELVRRELGGAGFNGNFSEWLVSVRDQAIQTNAKLDQLIELLTPKA